MTLKLDSEMEKDLSLLKKYLKKKNVAEAKLRLQDGTILTFNFRDDDHRKAIRELMTGITGRIK